MCSIDLEPCSVWKQSIVTARKEHACDCCGGRIRVGKPYVRHFSVFDGAATSEKMCDPCARICQEFLADHGQVTIPSSMRQLLEDCIGDPDDDDGKRWRLHTLNMDRRARRAAPTTQTEPT